MKLYFLRHGIAFDAREWEGSDFDRPLTDDGKRRMKREARAIARLNLAPSFILTSPLVRAQQTASIVARGLELRDRLSEDERLGPGFGPDALARIAADRDGAESLMLVGHEPSFSETIGELIGGARVELKKGGLACVELDATLGSARLAWLLPPKVLSA